MASISYRQRWSPRGRNLKSLASKSVSPRKCPVLGSRRALFFDFGAKTFFWRSLPRCILGTWPWLRALLSLASRGSVLGRVVLGLGLGFFVCPWPRALCMSSTPPLVRGAISSSGTPNQFLFLFKFCFNGDASTRFLLLVLLVFETFMSKKILPFSKNFQSLSPFF